MKLLQLMGRGMAGTGAFLILGLAGASDCGAVDLNRLVAQAAFALCVLGAGLLLGRLAKGFCWSNGGMAHGKGRQSKVKTAVSA